MKIRIPTEKRLPGVGENVVAQGERGVVVEIEVENSFTRTIWVKLEGGRISGFHPNDVTKI